MNAIAIILLFGLANVANCQQIVVSANPDLLYSTGNSYGLYGAPEGLYSFNNDFGILGSPEMLYSTSNDYGLGVKIDVIEPRVEFINTSFEAP